MDEKTKHTDPTQKTPRPALLPLQDLLAAVGLLSRLPVRVDAQLAMARGAAAAWAYPLAGLVVALLAGCAGTVALVAGLPASIAAALALLTSVVITGAMHEDGLADSADGLWGGWDRDRRLEIMKDSRTGVYGVAAIVLSLLLRWLALATLLEAGVIWAALVTAAMTSRAAMTVLMAALPHARSGGLSHAVGRPARAMAAVAAGLAACAALAFWQADGLAVIAAVTAAGMACGAIAQRKIGGQTGDILGAAQQVTEIAALLAMVALTGS